MVRRRRQPPHLTCCLRDRPVFPNYRTPSPVAFLLYYKWFRQLCPPLAVNHGQLDSRTYAL